ncbi:MAG TPA: cupin domain-containing protein, partial [Chitinophagaceae bacterium]
MRSLLIVSFLAFTSPLLSQQTDQKKAKDDSLKPAVHQWSKLEAKKEDNRIRRQILDGSTTSLSNLEIHASTLEPGDSPHPPHKHDDIEELIIITEGTVKITIGADSKVLGKGSIAFAMPGDEHGIENVGKTRVTYYIL